VTFEKRISDEAVRLARNQIAAGQSLRAAAAAIGCAPSTLSVRIRKAEADENRIRLAVEGRTDSRKSPKRSAPRGKSEAGIDPVGVLREALSATKSGGEPDWRVRLAALKQLAELRPDEFAPEPNQPNEYPILVHDLAPDAPPVLHLAGGTLVEVALRYLHPPPTPEPQSLNTHTFIRQEIPDGRFNQREEFCIGIWTPYGVSAEGHSLSHETSDPEQAELWRAELSAGRLPQDVIDAEAEDEQ
jgi:hypothetical protein